MRTAIAFLVMLAVMGGAGARCVPDLNGGSCPLEVDPYNLLIQMENGTVSLIQNIPGKDKCEEISNRALRLTASKFEKAKADFDSCVAFKLADPNGAPNLSCQARREPSLDKTDIRIAQCFK